MKKNVFGIMTTLMVCFFMIILLMGMISFYMNFEYDRFYAKFHQSYTQMADLVNVQDALTNMYNAIALLTDTHDARKADAFLLEYNQERQNAQAALAGLKQQLQGRAYYYMSDLEKMLLTFDERAQAVKTLWDKDTSLVYLKAGVHELGRTKGYIENELSAAQTHLVRQAQEHYVNYESNRSAVQMRLYILFAVVGLLCMVFALYISNSISAPIRTLVARMEHFVRTGKDERAEQPAYLGAEMQSLVGSYDSMIEQLMSKNELERELAQQQLRNEQMRSLVQSSELSMLQMQMNPHFLFNTLNSVNALAQIENAPRTCDMVDNLAGMLRYALSDLDKLVPLSREMGIINNYFYIQKVRFGNRIQFIVDADEDAMDTVVPAMMIQPLIENAIVHGLEGKEGPGRIWVQVHKVAGCVQIIVRDDGVGMSKARLSQVRQTNQQTDSRRGIGLDNVMRRMNLLYGEKYVTIDSEEGQGTTVTVNVPTDV